MAAHCNLANEDGEYGLDTVSAHPDVHLKHLSSRQHSAPASPSSSYWRNSRAACADLHEQTTLQGSKTLRRDRHSQLGLQLLCPVLVKISTGFSICISIKQMILVPRVGTAVPAKTQLARAETKIPRTLQNNLY